MNVFFNTYFLFVFNIIYRYILNMSIGTKLKELRKDLKISQKELGNLLNVAQQVVSYYENSGNIDASKLALISKHYNIDIRFFFGDKSLDSFRGFALQPNSAGGPVIPLGWDDILDDLCELDHDKLKVVEKVIRTLIAEFSN